MLVTLTRFCYSEDMGTFGFMEVGGVRTFVGERPWKDNEPRVSCIPEGVYKVQAHNSPKFGRCWILEGGTVGHHSGERTHILFHAGNVPTEDSLGCLLPGLGLGAINGKWAVTGSKLALARMKDHFPAAWDLHITSAPYGRAAYTPA